MGTSREWQHHPPQLPPSLLWALVFFFFGHKRISKAYGCAPCVVLFCYILQVLLSYTIIHNLILLHLFLQVSLRANSQPAGREMLSLFPLIPLKRPTCLDPCAYVP